MEITEDQAIELALHPDKIIDPLQCNVVIGFMNGIISDMALACWELEVNANNQHQSYLEQDGKSIPLKEAEFKNSKHYKDLRELQLKLAKFRAYRNDLRRKEEMLKNTSSYIRNNYADYPRVIK